eukprot:Pgem_evm1s4407
MLWAVAKRYSRRECDCTTQGLLATIPVVALESVPQSRVAKFFRRCRNLVYLYDKKSSYNVSLYAHKKYKSHRKVPENIFQLYETEKNNTKEPAQLSIIYLNLFRGCLLLYNNYKPSKKNISKLDHVQSSFDEIRIGKWTIKPDQNDTLLRIMPEGNYKDSTFYLDSRVGFIKTNGIHATHGISNIYNQSDPATDQTH